MNLRFACSIAILFCVAGASLAAQVPDENAAEVTLIKSAIDSFIASFNRGDAADVAGFWNGQGELTTVADETLKGTAAIEASFQEFFANNPGVRIEIVEPSIRILSPNVAIEEGAARTIRPNQQPVETKYTAVHVKQGGNWKLDSLRETQELPTSSHYEQLKPLEWLIGSWVEQDEYATVESVFDWTKNQNFITRTFKVTSSDGSELEGTQVIGWDPSRNTIRSWMFDSEGAFGVGIWSQSGDQWTIRKIQTLTDGATASAINIVTCVDENTFKFKSTNREVEGKLLPNIPETVVNRK